MDGSVLASPGAAAPPPRFDAALLARYDRPLPRYTSYPTAPQFHPGFGEADLRAALAASNRGAAAAPLSLYLHVPYCFSPCFYCGCNRIISRDRSKAQPYLARLLAEADLLAGLLDPARPVQQLHLGGGTPNFLGTGQLKTLLDGLARRLRLSHGADRDFSIELDPRLVQPGDLDALAAMGFNRVSFGIQDLDPVVQEEINRVQSATLCLDLLAQARAAGLDSVNVDLVYGLPRQTHDGFGATLDAIIEARPHRLAVYAYAHHPQLFKAQRRFQPDTLPGGAAKLALLELAINRLTAAGYVYLGMDHFALPADPLAQAFVQGRLQRNFMGYSTLGECDLLGMGVSAISKVGGCYSQNHKDLPTWQQNVDAGQLPVWRGIALTAEDQLRAALIQELMCTTAIDITAFQQRHGLDFRTRFAAELKRLQPLIDDGLVTLAPAAIQATARGQLLLRPIAACFDAYLGQ